jgi:hypothetical protein
VVFYANARRLDAIAITLSLGSVTLECLACEAEGSANHTGECPVRVSRQRPQFPWTNRSRGRRGEGWDCLKIVGFLNPCETRAFAMLDKPISPLRQRMIEDITARHFAEKAQVDYVRRSATSRRYLSRGCFPVRY